MEARTAPDAELDAQPHPAPALADLDALVAEVAASYPLLAYAAASDPEDETGAIDSMILAGLVSP